MKVKTSELTGVALDWAVAKCLQAETVIDKVGRLVLDTYQDDPPEGINEYNDCRWQAFSPSTDWAQGGPILNRYKISRTVDHSGLWIAYTSYNLNDEKRYMQCDRSELVAGLRCFVASRLVEEVEIPEELLGEI